MITAVIRLATAPAPPRPKVSAEAQAEQAARRRDRSVFLPPPSVLRRLAPAPRRPAAPRPQPEAAIPPRLAPPAEVPAPMPTPELRDGIRVGPQTAQQARRPLVLDRERDLASGTGADRRPGPVATPSPEPPRLGREERAGIGGPGQEREPLEPEAGRAPTPGRPDDAPRGPDGGPRRRAGQAERSAGTPGGQRSIAESLRRLQQDLGQGGTTTGTPGAIGQQMGPLFFDPQGADFTAWINHFKNEVYRNWIVPQAALFGAVQGHVDFAFTVNRDGTIAEVRLLKSSGTAALDRAAGNALFGARLLALPSEYAPGTVTMQISFFYGAERS